jgi:hypothetical protein
LDQKTLSRSLKVLKLTPSQKAAADKLLLGWDEEQFFNPKTPYELVLASWEDSGGTGLSPFALAGIFQHSPRRIVRNLEATKACVSTFLCTMSLLPILAPGFGRCKFSTEFYDKDVETYFRGEDSQACSDWGEPESPREHYFSAMLKRYGGKNWRQHCTRTFNPFNATCSHPSPQQWARYCTFASHFRRWKP